MSETYSEYDGRPELQSKAKQVGKIRKGIIIAIITFSVLMLTLAGVNALFSFATRAALLDCTQTSGQCYKQQAKRTQAFLDDFKAQLNADAEKRADVTRERVATMLFCQDKVGAQSIDQITRCVNNQIRKEQNP